MTDTEQHRAFRSKLKKIKEYISKLDDELLIKTIDIIGEEMQARSDKYNNLKENE